MSTSLDQIRDEQEVREPAPRKPARAARRFVAVVFDSDLHRSAISVFDQAVVGATNFATSVIIGRMCSRESLGAYYLALTMVLFVRGIQDQVISAPYMIYCNRRGGKSLASYAGSTFMHQLVILVIAVACLLGVALTLSTGLGSPGLTAAVWVLLGAAPFILLREFIRRFAFAHLRVYTAIAIDITVALLQIGGLILLAYLGLLSVAWVYCVIGGACAIACLGWFFAKKQPLRFVRRRFAADWIHNWAFGRWTLAGQLAGSLAPYTLPWILALAHGEAATGVLAACYTLVGLSNMFVNGVCNFLMPRAAHAYAADGLDGLRQVLRKTALIFAVGLGAFFLVVLATGDWLAVFVYGSEYAGCGIIMTLLAFSMLAGSMGATASNGLLAIEQPRANCIADICMSTVMLAVAFCTVYPLGVLGAAIAATTGTAAGAVVRCLVLFQATKVIRLGDQPEVIFP